MNLLILFSSVLKIQGGMMSLLKNIKDLNNPDLMAIDEPLPNSFAVLKVAHKY